MRLDLLAIVLVLVALFTVEVSSEETSVRECVPEGFQKGVCILIEKSLECKGSAIASSSCASTHICCTPGDEASAPRARRGRAGRAPRRGGRVARRAPRRPGSPGTICEPTDNSKFGSGRCVRSHVKCRGGNQEAPTTKCLPGLKCCAPQKTAELNRENTDGRPKNPRSRANLAPGTDISVSARQCIPVSREFGRGNCVTPALGDQCRRTPGAAVVPAQDCHPRDGNCCLRTEVCCAPRVNPRRQSVDPSEKTKTCRPSDPNLPVGICVVNPANCKGTSKIVAHVDGCIGKAQCCSDVAKAIPAKGASRACIPNDQHYFIGTGICVPGGSSARRECNIRERSITPATGCEAGFECCARRKPLGGHCTTPVGFTHGRCIPVDMLSSCSNPKQIVRGSEGCESREACCAEKVEAESCKTPAVSVVNRLHHDYEWSVPAPYVDWNRTEPYAENGVVVGIKLFFRVLVQLGLKADVTCINCGKTTRFIGLNVDIIKNIFVPFKVTGQSYRQFTRGTRIPGLNVELLALEVAELRETATDVKDSVELLMTRIRGAPALFKCSLNGIDRHNTANQIPAIVGGKAKRSLEALAASSDAEMLEMISEHLSLDSDDGLTITVADEVHDLQLGGINVDANMN